MAPPPQVRIAAMILVSQLRACEREAFRIYRAGGGVKPNLSHGIRARLGEGDPPGDSYVCNACQTESGAPWCFKCQNEITGDPL